MDIQATIPSIGAITVDPGPLVINQSIRIQVQVCEVSALVTYTWPCAGAQYSGEEAIPWP